MAVPRWPEGGYIRCALCLETSSWFLSSGLIPYRPFAARSMHGHLTGLELTWFSLQMKKYMGILQGKGDPVAPLSERRIEAISMLIPPMTLGVRDDEKVSGIIHVHVHLAGPSLS